MDAYIFVCTFTVRSFGRPNIEGYDNKKKRSRNVQNGIYFMSLICLFMNPSIKHEYLVWDEYL